MKDSITMEYLISLKFFTVKISATRSDDGSTDAVGHSGGRGGGTGEEQRREEKQGEKGDRREERQQEGREGHFLYTESCPYIAFLGGILELFLSSFISTSGHSFFRLTSRMTIYIITIKNISS